MHIPTIHHRIYFRTFVSALIARSYETFAQSQRYRFPQEGQSHHSTLTLLLFPDFRSGDALSGLETRILASLFEILEPFSCFRKVLC